MCQARAAGLEAALLHVVGAQLTRLAALAVAAATFTGLQLPLQQGLFFRELILCDPLVRPVHTVSAVQAICEVRFHTHTRDQDAKNAFLKVSYTGENVHRHILERIRISSKRGLVMDGSKGKGMYWQRREGLAWWGRAPCASHHA